MQRSGPEELETERSADDSDVGWGGSDDDSARADPDDRRLVEERPPHHDRP